MTPLVFLPGLMCDGRLFEPVIAGLPSDLESQVTAISGQDSMAKIAADVLDACPPRFALAGLSMGGIVAMEIMAQAPERVDRLALLDTNPWAELEAVKAGRRSQIDAVRAGRLADIMRDELKPKYLVAGPNRSAILACCMAMALDLGPDVFERQSIALRDRPDYRDVLRTVTVPSLVLCGAQDLLCPQEQHELMAGLIKGSRLTIIENAGHLPPLEQPEQTIAALTRWLED